MKVAINHVMLHVTYRAFAWLDAGMTRKFFNIWNEEVEQRGFSFYLPSLSVYRSLDGPQKNRLPSRSFFAWKGTDGAE